jgi:hypothetical protein
MESDASSPLISKASQVDEITGEKRVDLSKWTPVEFGLPFAI